MIGELKSVQDLRATVEAMRTAQRSQLSDLIDESIRLMNLSKSHGDLDGTQQKKIARQLVVIRNAAESSNTDTYVSNTVSNAVKGILPVLDGSIERIQNLQISAAEQQKILSEIQNRELASEAEQAEYIRKYGFNPETSIDSVKGLQGLVNEMKAIYRRLQFTPAISPDIINTMAIRATTGIRETKKLMAMGKIPPETADAIIKQFLSIAQNANQLERARIPLTTMFRMYGAVLTNIGNLISGILKSASNLGQGLAWGMKNIGWVALGLGAGVGGYMWWKTRR